MGDLLYHVDRCDSQWVSGWIYKGDVAPDLAVYVNGIWVADLLPTNFRIDLRNLGIGDGRCGFQFCLAGYVGNGVSRVTLKVDGATLYERQILVFDAPIEHPDNSPYGFVRPKLGERVSWPRISIVAKISSSDALSQVQLMTMGEFLKDPADRNILASSELVPSKIDASTMTTDMAIPRELVLPADCVLVAANGTDELVAATLLRIEPAPHEHRSDNDQKKRNVAHRDLGPLTIAQSKISNFVRPNQTILDFTPAEKNQNFLEPNAIGGQQFYELYPSERSDASKSFMPDLSWGNELPQFQTLHQQLTWRSAPAYSCRLENVVLFPDFGLTIFEDKYIWGDSLIPATNADPHFSRIPGLFSIGDEIFASLPQYFHLDTASVPFVLFISYNYSHWLQNSVAAAWHALRSFGSSATFILPSNVSRVMMDTLALLGVQQKSIIYADGPVIGFDSVIYPSLINTHSNMYPSSYNTGAFDALRQAVEFLGDIGETPQRIFISRREGLVSSPRILENEAEISQELEKFGFVTVSLHKLSFAEQVRLFSKAEIIVGQIGAGLVNLAFAPQGCFILELCNDSFNTNEFLWLAALKKHRYVRAMAKTATARSSIDFSFHIPRDVIRSIVDAIIAE